MRKNEPIHFSPNQINSQTDAHLTSPLHPLLSVLVHCIHAFVPMVSLGDMYVYANSRRPYGSWRSLVYQYPPDNSWWLSLDSSLVLRMPTCFHVIASSVRVHVYISVNYVQHTAFCIGPPLLSQYDCRVLEHSYNMSFTLIFLSCSPWYVSPQPRPHDPWSPPPEGHGAVREVSATWQCNQNLRMGHYFQFYVTAETYIMRLTICVPSHMSGSMYCTPNICTSAYGARN